MLTKKLKLKRLEKTRGTNEIREKLLVHRKTTETIDLRRNLIEHQILT